MNTEEMVWALEIVEAELEQDIEQEAYLRVVLSGKGKGVGKAVTFRRVKEYENLLERRNALTARHGSPEQMLRKVRELIGRFQGDQRGVGMTFTFRRPVRFCEPPICHGCGHLRVGEVLGRCSKCGLSNGPKQPKPPWWSGKDVSGWLRHRGWIFAAAGMALSSQSRTQGAVVRTAAKYVPRLFIREQWIIDSNQPPDVDGPNLVARARAELAELEDATEENTSQHEGGDLREAESGSGGAGDHGDDPAR